MSANAQTQDLRENLRLRSDLVFSRPGAQLRISFWVCFAARNAARVVLSANDQQLFVVSALNYGPGGNYTSTSTSTNSNSKSANGDGWGGKRGMAKQKGKLAVGGQRGACGGEWTHVVVDYEAVDRLLQLSFSYQLDAASGNIVGLDTVVILQPDVVHPPLSLPPVPSATTFATTVRSASSAR
ncbi:hypothetical protein F5Y03DRAFT_348135 [Xylaria venustula]|nr:hypothetical protein F5Y03DRAFT_348135 [Xylaria venustula]